MHSALGLSRRVLGLSLILHISCLSPEASGPEGQLADGAEVVVLLLLWQVSELLRSEGVRQVSIVILLVSLTTLSCPLNDCFEDQKLS